ncbi:MRC1-like domain-containing protein [Podospora australis]|uniref:MRC1-like domain-containing protein n=1 Tax=Podospora australis TaxID=1536484 RepID=A0AAN6X0Q8_9PEZI|nr:MRC1-like domain-containing protein [Podospora australis]
MASSPISQKSASASPSPTKARIRSNNRFLIQEESSSSEDEDVDEILKPRGKMAARMQAMQGGSKKDTQEESEPDSDARSSSPAKKPGGTSVEDEDEDEDEIVAPRPRKLLKARRHRRATPKVTPQEDGGLFVSPAKPTEDAASDDNEDEALPSILNPSRLQELIAEKRAQRLAREAEEQRKKEERRKAMPADDVMDLDDEDDDNITDDEGGRKLTQDAASKARPARKASKKALEEMNRETQRMNRSLQLGYEAKVKKKITKSALFERFNFKPQGQTTAAVKPLPADSSRAGTPGSIQQSDAEVLKDGETPPSSPPVADTEKAAAPVPETIPEVSEEQDEDGLPTLEDFMSTSAATKRTLDKGKGKATEADFAAEDEAAKKAALPRVKRNFRVKFPAVQVNNATTTTTMSLDDDDDLEVAPKHSSKLDEMLARIAPNGNKEPKALVHLRRLAQLDDPEKKAGPVPTKQKSGIPQKPAMTVGELQLSLLQKARYQAKLERDRHLEELKAKGIVIQTAEEREKEMQQVEDIVAKARKEAEEIMQREREDAKKDKKKTRAENGEDPLDWDDSDFDGSESDEEMPDEPEIELSGSEEEEEEEEEGEEVEGNALVDDGAEDAEESADEVAEEEEASIANSDDEDELPSTKQVRRRAKKQAVILSDDEDNDEPVVKATPAKGTLPKSPSVRSYNSPSVPTSVLRSATKTFIPGLPVAGPAGLGLTQIFQGTMDDSQIDSDPMTSPSQPRPTFDPTAFPDSQFSQSVQNTGDEMIMDSQPSARRDAETQNAETQGVQIGFSQSQVHGFDSLLRDDEFNNTQESLLIEPTQDQGYQDFSPIKQRFVDAPTSTVDTVQLDDASQVAESPLVRRTGKLRRKADIARAGSPAVSDGEGDKDEFGLGTVPASNNAFAAMKEAARKEKERKRKEAFDKKKSKAKEMVEEQAEESEDEYAGLGGADGEDASDDEDAKSVQEMIDDETMEDANDERKLAAFFADRERASDEKQVEKLFHDITTGMLRKKRAGNWDELSDDDDGGEARRRLKRRQFAKMQRALFADERISKVAENPRNQAFLRTIEDHGSDDDMDFIFAPPPPALPTIDSQSQSEAVVIPNSQPAVTNPRRTKTGKKPSNIGEIRETLSNLLDDGPQHSSSFIPATELGSGSENEAEEEEEVIEVPSSNKENAAPANPRRSKPVTSSSSQIVDRISLKRNTSSMVSSTGKLAFASAGGGVDQQGFKVPALLRRATTNSSSASLSTVSMSATGVTTSNGPSGGSGGDGIKIKKTAGKKSGVSYLARGNERQAALAESEKRREERRYKGATTGDRQKMVGGLFGAGKFE